MGSKQEKTRVYIVAFSKIYETVQIYLFLLQQNGYYGLLTGLGCVPCNCSQFGSVSDDCNDQGQCHCVPGVAGEKCDRCAHGFYAFQDGGCTRKL